MGAKPAGGGIQTCVGTDIVDYRPVFASGSCTYTSGKVKAEMAPGHMARRVLITGANGGIGFEVAKQILAKGHNIILTCRDASKAEKAVALLE